jgi:hypothetical protein
MLFFVQVYTEKLNTLIKILAICRLHWPFNSSAKGLNDVASTWQQPCVFLQKIWSIIDPEIPVCSANSFQAPVFLHALHNYGH